MNSAVETSSLLRSLHGKLLHRIRKRFDVVSNVYAIGALRVPFVQVRDADKVLDEVVAEEDRRDKLAGRKRDEDELHLPYWAELWDSAFGVSEFVVRDHLRHSHEAIEAGRTTPTRTLDLGCGMGLTGAVAATLGHSVLLADLEQDALLFARLNTIRFGRRARTRRLNWQKDRLDEQFDLIIGADVLYEKSQWDYLEPFWQHHLADGGSVLLGEPGRQTGDLFIEWIKDKPWTVERFEEPVITRPKPIRLFRLKRENVKT